MQMALLERIEKHLKRHRISATRFGRLAVRDPRFVLDLRMGRKPRRRTILRLEGYLARFEAEALVRSEAPINSCSGRVCSISRSDEQYLARGQHRLVRFEVEAAQSVRR